jgi:hypothetical protein
MWLIVNFARRVTALRHSTVITTKVRKKQEIILPVRTLPVPVLNRLLTN